MIFDSYKQGRDSAEILLNQQCSPAPLLVSDILCEQFFSVSFSHKNNFMLDNQWLPVKSQQIEIAKNVSLVLTQKIIKGQGRSTQYFFFLPFSISLDQESKLAYSLIHLQILDFNVRESEQNLKVVFRLDKTQCCFLPQYLPALICKKEKNKIRKEQDQQHL